MNELEKMRARLKEILAKMDEFKAMTDFSDEDAEQINALHEEFDTLKKNIETAEKIEAMSVKAETSVRKIEAKAEVGVDRRTLDPKGGFSNQGEFFRAVAQASNGRVDKRLTIQGAAMQEKIGEDGGFLLPADFRTEIAKKVNGDESLLPKTRQFQTSSNTLVLPTNEVAPWDGTGIQAYWEGESGTYTESKAKFGETSLRLHKLTAMVKVTDELLEDAPALESWIKGEAPSAMMHKVNSAIISGTGAGMPQGFLNSGFKYKQAKVGGQSADTVLFENVNNMQGRLLPNSIGRAVWLINPAVRPLLPLMKFDTAATSPVPVYLPQTGVSGMPYGSLYGMPILPMMGGSKALGDEGDISLVDLSYYYTAVKTTGIKSDMSAHVYFSTGEMAFRFTMRLAGQCPFKAPITSENGSYSMSGFVTLEDR